MAKTYFLDYRRLKPHEQIRKSRLMKLAREIRCDGRVKRPIIVDRKTLVILDGHHRYNAIKLLGWQKIPAYFVHYRNKHIIVKSWRKNVTVTKEQVLTAGLTGNLLKPKTSRHIVPNGLLR